MNPWFEEHWPGVHARLIAYLADAIAEGLPEDLISMPEEGVYISADNDRGSLNFRADVAISGQWESEAAQSWQSAIDIPADSLEARAAVPTILQTAPMKERWVEIREDSGRLITVIEVLSPGNKQGEGWHDYLTKRRALLESPVSLVEIDLILSGRPVFPESAAKLPRLDHAHYFISTKRSGTTNRREVLRPLLREPLPVIGIPLRTGEKDVFVDLQPLIDKVHDTGKYRLLNYSSLPDVPLSIEDQSWLRSLVAGW